MALAPIIDFYEHLTPAALDGLERLYTPDARFKDPFNEVQGVDAIARIFRHMYTQVQAPRFEVTGTVGEAGAPGGAVLLWTFHFEAGWGRGRPQCIRGVTHLRFAADGRVAEHRDYWDAAEELYAKLPLLGPLLRALQRRLAAR